MRLVIACMVGHSTVVRQQSAEVRGMIWIVTALTVLFGISYAVYRTARTESTGFKALVAWVSFAGLDIAAIIGWIVWSQLKGA
jgi:hypothetical protein